MEEEKESEQTVNRKPVAVSTSSSRHRFQIVIRRVEQPFSDRVDEEFNWLLQCLGFFEPIDKGKTAACVFKELVKAAEQEGGKSLTSTELAERIGMSRGAVINHLNNLLRSGLILRDGSKYMARSRSMFRTIKEIQDEIDLV
ncbi:MAG: winged helix-turn-helix domain-containing protein, partial [archaeon]